MIYIQEVRVELLSDQVFSLKGTIWNILVYPRSTLKPQNRLCPALESSRVSGVNFQSRLNLYSIYDRIGSYKAN